MSMPRFSSLSALDNSKTKSSKSKKRLVSIKKRKMTNTGTVSITGTSQMAATFCFEDGEFDAKEVGILRSSFESLKRDRDEVAMKLLQSASALDGAIDSYQNACKDIGNEWCAVHFGIILMGGMERCLLRVNDSKALKDMIQRLSEKHANSYHLPSGMMLMAFQACQPVVISEIQKYHQCDANDASSNATSNDDTCPVCYAWIKFFQVVTSYMAFYS